MRPTRAVVMRVFGSFVGTKEHTLPHSISQFLPSFNKNAVKQTS